MFKCQITGRVSKLREKCNKIVIETRPKTYTHWDEEAEEEWQTHGTEIVREINATQSGLDLWNSWTTERQDLFVQGL